MSIRTDVATAGEDGEDGVPVKGATTVRHLFWWSVGIVAALVPLGLPWLSLGYVVTAVTMAVAVLGVNLMAGFVGRVALGHGAFVGLGAYTAVILAADHGWPLLAVLPVAGVTGFVVGGLIAIPSLRIRGLHLALVSLAFGASFGPIVKRFEPVTGGANGKGSNASWVAPTWLGEGREADMRWAYLVVLMVAVTVFVVVSNLTRGRVGRSLVALRDNELAARTCGVHVRRYTVGMFGVSAAVASIAGVLIVIRQPFVSYESFETPFSLQLFAAATLGGLATIRGAVVGGATLVAVPYLVRRAGLEIDSSVIFGALLILAVVAFPSGLAGGTRRIRPA